MTYQLAHDLKSYAALTAEDRAIQRLISAAELISVRQLEVYSPADISKIEKGLDTSSDDFPFQRLKLAVASADPHLNNDTENVSSGSVFHLGAISSDVNNLDADVPGSSTSSHFGFADFASEFGLTELGDLFEAAAAYQAFVLGEADFSRPQLLKLVNSACATDFSREEGLREFGRLLRQSRIVKLDNGRFQVSVNTKYGPDSQAERA